MRSHEIEILDFSISVKFMHSVDPKICCFVDRWLQMVQVAAIPGVSRLDAQIDTSILARNAYPEFLTPSLRHGLDTFVSSCTDFDRFVNGTWRDSTEIEKDKDPIDVFKVTSRRTPIIIQRILDPADLRTNVKRI